MRILITLFCLIQVATLHAQNFPAKVYNSSQEDGTVQIWVDNDAYNPITVELTGKLTNMDSNDPLPSTFIVPANAKKHHLTDFTPRPNKSWKYDFGSRLFHGDLGLVEDYISDHVYQLPIESGKGYFISQGYNGSLSHRGENALDFDMPIGSPVYAARAGTVTKIIDRHNQSCPNESCNQFNNIVVIYHEDGSFAEYVHLAQNSAKVSLGDVVETGQQIAESGNTGWTTGPHLHLAIYIPVRNGRKTIQTNFAVEEGEIKYLNHGDRF